MMEYLTHVAAGFIPLPLFGWSIPALVVLAVVIARTGEAIAAFVLAAAVRQPFERALDGQSAARFLTGLLLLPLGLVLVFVACLAGLSLAARLSAAATRIAGVI